MKYAYLILWCALWTLLGYQLARAEPMPGLAMLGGARYQELAAGMLPQGWAASVFYQVDGFGNSKDLIKTWAENGVPRITVQLMWRDNHVFTKRDFKVIWRRAKSVRSLAQAYPETEFRVSGATEHRLNAKRARELARGLELACPECVVVNTPVTGGALLTNYVNELRPGQQRIPKRIKRFDFSFDGTTTTPARARRLYNKFRNAETFYLWVPAFNGRQAVDDATPRMQRSAWPTESTINKLTSLSLK